MADKKEVSILLLGIVAILAIVGLVLLFTSPAATGKAFFPPPLPPEVAYPAPVGYEPGYYGGQYDPSGYGNALIVAALEGSNLPLCPNGRMRTREQGNIDYEAIPDHLCNWFYCPGLADSTDPRAKPMLACVAESLLT
jgi:hypothetical protein